MRYFLAAYVRLNNLPALPLSTLGTVPAAGILLIFGIDKFMSECRALVNFYGNAVATLVIAKWDGALDIDGARQVLASRTAPELSGPQEPATVRDADNPSAEPGPASAPVEPALR